MSAAEREEFLSQFGEDAGAYRDVLAVIDLLPEDQRGAAEWGLGNEVFGCCEEALYSAVAAGVVLPPDLEARLLAEFGWYDDVAALIARTHGDRLTA